MFKYVCSYWIMIVMIGVWRPDKDPERVTAVPSGMRTKSVRYLKFIMYLPEYVYWPYMFLVHSNVHNLWRYGELLAVCFTLVSGPPREGSQGPYIGYVNLMISFKTWRTVRAVKYILTAVTGSQCGGSIIFNYNILWFPGLGDDRDYSRNPF